MSTDILTDLKTLLDTDWTAGNTGSRTPTITKIYELKTVDFAIAGSKDHIFIYTNNASLEDNASGGSSKERVQFLTIDLRTMFSRDQVILIANEVERIIKANGADPFGDQSYDIGNITDETDYSDKFVKLFRIVLKAEFTSYNC